MASGAGLDRFKRAQDRPGVGFDAALREIQAGQKESHWIWYVFPQLAGLGWSSQARTYGIDGVQEAVEYLNDALLAERLRIIAGAVAAQLDNGASLDTLMGSSIDAQKVISSMTLFGGLARDLSSEPGASVKSLADVAERILTIAEAQGYPACAYTLEKLAKRRD